MSKPKPLHVLRGLLRVSKSPPLPKEMLKRGPQESPNAIQRFVMAQYRQNQSQPCEKTRALLNQTAINYLEMKKDLLERARLYKLDTGAEVQLGGAEMSRRAAARSGLQLPKLDPELDSYVSSLNKPK